MNIVSVSRLYIKNKTIAYFNEYFVKGSPISKALTCTKIYLY